MEILHAKTKERQLEVRCPINDNVSCWQKGKKQGHEDAKCQKELTKTKYYTPIQSELSGKISPRKKPRSNNLKVSGRKKGGYRKVVQRNIQRKTKGK